MHVFTSLRIHGTNIEEMRGTLEQNLTLKLKQISVARFSGIAEENAVGTPRKREKSWLGKCEKSIRKTDLQTRERISVF